MTKAEKLAVVQQAIHELEQASAKVHTLLKPIEGAADATDEEVYRLESLSGINDDIDTLYKLVPSYR